jgi:hypothetical protein
LFCLNIASTLNVRNIRNRIRPLFKHQAHVVSLEVVEVFGVSPGDFVVE